MKLVFCTCLINFLRKCNDILPKFCQMYRICCLKIIGMLNFESEFLNINILSPLFHLVLFSC